MEYTLENVRKDEQLKEEFKEHFFKIVEECGEFVIPNTSIDYVIDIMILQGYWSGNVYNIYFGDYGLEYEQRRFG
jgi:2-hydroxy-3-keto-5-methylthiopentenyl-1-phosphate phosphatase